MRRKKIKSGGDNNHDDEDEDDGDGDGDNGLKIREKLKNMAIKS